MYLLNFQFQTKKPKFIGFFVLQIYHTIKIYSQKNQINKRKNPQKCKKSVFFIRIDGFSVFLASKNETKIFSNGFSRLL